MIGAQHKKDELSLKAPPPQTAGHPEGSSSSAGRNGCHCSGVRCFPREISFKRGLLFVRNFALVSYKSFPGYFDELRSFFCRVNF